MEKQDQQYLFLLILIGTVLSIIFFQGSNPYFDDASYLKYSNQMLNGTYNITTSPYAYGIGFLEATALSTQLTGISVLPEMIAYIGIIILTYLTAKRYLEKNVAFASALGLALSAFLIVYSTRLLPDMLVGFIISLCIYLMIKYNENREALVFTGIILGSLITIKLSSVLLGFILLICYWRIYKSNTRVLLVSFLGMILAYAILSAILGGNIFNMISIYDALQARISTSNLEGNIFFILISIGGYMLPARLFSQLFPLGAIGLLTLAGIWLYARKAIKLGYRIKGLEVMALYSIISLFYMLFGTESLTSWTYLTNETRYMIYFAVPIAIFAGYALQRAIDYKRQWNTQLIILFLILIIISNIPQYIFFITNRQYHFRF